LLNETSQSLIARSAFEKPVVGTAAPLGQQP
jgi:hypothetical protein